MQRNLIGIILLVLLVLEGALLPWIIPYGWQTEVRVVPHFMLTVVLFVAVYWNRHYALVYGLIFGMIQDVVYVGHMLGVFSFSLGLAGYLTGLVFRKKTMNFVLMMVTVVLGNLLFEGIIYGIYRLFRVVNEEIGWAFMHHIMPSLFINLLFALIIYIPLRKLLESVDHSRGADEQG